MTITHFVVSDSFGGVEGHICTLIKLFNNHEYDFKIVCNTTVESRFREKLSGYDVEIRSLELLPKMGVTNFKKLIETFGDLSSDIVQCHLYSATRIGAIAAKFAGVDSVIETIHIEEVWRKGLKKLVFCGADAIIGRLFVDRYIAVSGAVAQYYRENKWVPEKKISLIHNTTEHEGAMIEDEKKFAYRLGFLGRLVHQKGLDILIKAMGLLKDKGARWTLIIGGTGPLKNDLTELVNEEGLQDKVTFSGNISEKDHFFNDIDVFVLPSRFEGFPLVLIEAGMYKMPVIATKVSGNPEIIRDNETGILVESENEYALAEAIEKYTDEAIRNQYSRSLKKLVESEFSKERYVEKMDDFYQSLRMN